MLTIGKLADTCGVGVETVRFYQRRHLLEVPPRDGGIRRYGPQAVNRLRFIRRAQQAGFTLEEIRELIALDAGHDRTRARAMATARLARLDAQIADLQRARASLHRLANACAQGTTGPCPILDAFTEPGTPGVAVTATGR